ncbi:uncharacterized protein LOC123886358 [Trifolium pratense]|uniref:uncharacterized protein LOC123886358 n=1 Tax=Trifolium pratense TaxID=57577 RepID=UPI001E692CC2|nr:uncharacterized protein LOC123886358 [Trifolium pratense]
MVLRRSDGSVVGAATRIHSGSTDVVTGEALGLYDGIDWIEKFDVHQVIIEMDSQLLVNAVKGKTLIRKNWGCVVRRCIKLLEDNPNIDIRWVKRSANRVAHDMANWAEIEPNREWGNDVPLCIWPFIQKIRVL